MQHGQPADAGVEHADRPCPRIASGSLGVIRGRARHAGHHPRAERYGRRIVRALVLSNMRPDAAHPERGTFVRDQVADLRRLRRRAGGRAVRVPSGRARARARGPRSAPPLRRPSTLSRRPAREPFDIVHAHYGLTAWPALAVPARVRALTVHGNDMRHPRTRMITGAALGRIDLLAAVSSSLAQELPSARARARAQVLPCGVDLERFHPIPRAQARDELGLDPERPYLLFAADPARAIKRYDLALDAGARGRRRAARPRRRRARARAAVVQRRQRGFDALRARGLRPGGARGARLRRAGARPRPSASTPRRCAASRGRSARRSSSSAWRAALEPHLGATESRIQGRAHAEPFSGPRLAEHVAAAWRTALRDAG